MNQAEAKTEYVDLDSVIEDTITVRLHGKDMKVPPIDLESFLKLANSFESMHVRAKQGDVSVQELTRSYHQMFSMICPEITFEDVENMTQAQCAAFMAIVIDKISGKLTPQNPEYAAAALVKKKTT